MSDKIPENPPAFPGQTAFDSFRGRIGAMGMQQTGGGIASLGPTHLSQKGMTLRDYFAGQALIALAQDLPINIDETSRNCYAIADAMLTVRAVGAK